MAFIDDLATITPAVRTFEAWLEQDPPEASEVLEAMRDDSLPIEPLLRVMRKNGIPCTRETVKGYRAA